MMTTCLQIIIKSDSFTQTHGLERFDRNRIYAVQAGIRPGSFYKMSYFYMIGKRLIPFTDWSKSVATNSVCVICDLTMGFQIQSDGLFVFLYPQGNSTTG